MVVFFSGNMTVQHIKRHLNTQITPKCTKGGKCMPGHSCDGHASTVAWGWACYVMPFCKLAVLMVYLYVCLCAVLSYLVYLASTVLVLCLGIPVLRQKLTNSPPSVVIAMVGVDSKLYHRWHNNQFVVVYRVEGGLMDMVGVDTKLYHRWHNNQLVVVYRVEGGLMDSVGVDSKLYHRWRGCL